MAAPNASGATTAQGSVKPVIGVVFYSMYGHVATLAEEVIAGVEAAGAIAKPYFIEETLPASVLEKMHAGASLKPKYPIVTPQDLVELDGFIFGIPTRYGRAPAQVSAFFDKTGGLWAAQALSGKYVGTFTSTASQHGGQELTHLTTMPFWAHHGCIYVPVGYKQPYLQNNDEVHGGSPWGVSTVANGDGSRVPTKGELEVARWQGEHFAGIVAQAVRGRHLLAADRSGSGAGVGTAAGVAAGAGAAGAAGVAGAAAAGSGSQQPQTGAARSEAPLASQPPDAAAAQQLAKEPVGPAAPTSAEAIGNAPSGTAGTGNAPTTGTDSDVGAAAAAGVAGAGAGAVATGATGATDAGEKTAGTTPATGAAGTTGTGARPTATAPQKKSGGLFSCCSGNSID